MYLSQSKARSATTPGWAPGFRMDLCYNSNLCAYLSKWHNFTKDNLELEWPFRATLT